jgi:hypothetical protein
MMTTTNWIVIITKEACDDTGSPSWLEIEDAAFGPFAAEADASGWADKFNTEYAESIYQATVRKLAKAGSW